MKANRSSNKTKKKQNMCYHYRRKHYDSCQSYFTRKFFPNANETLPLTIYLLQDSARVYGATLFLYSILLSVIGHTYAFTVASPDTPHTQNERGEWKQACHSFCCFLVLFFFFVCVFLFCLYSIFGIVCTQSRLSLTNLE